MPNILTIISTNNLILAYRILQDRYVSRLGFSSCNYDELQLIKAEMQRRIDATVNPYDNLTINKQEYASI